MTEEKHAKMNEGVTQIGRLIGVCAENGLGQDDVSIMMQTATSLFCEMNDIDIEFYIQFLYVLHRQRVEPGYDGRDEAAVHAEIAAMFAPEPTH
jgi:hypothetical protein